MTHYFTRRALITAIAMIGTSGYQLTCQAESSTSANTSTFNLSSVGIEHSPSGHRVATNGNGLFLHIYVENGTLYGQFVQAGLMQGERFVIAENVSDDNMISVAMNSSGSAVATWWNGTTAVAQLIPPNASGLTLNPINIGSGDGFEYALQVAMDDHGDFVVVRTQGNTAYASVFDQYGNTLSGDITVSNNCSSVLPLTSYDGNYYQSYGCAISVGMNTEQFVVAFPQSEGNRSRIYAQRYTHNGTPQGNLITVDNTPANTGDSKKQTLYSALDPQIAMDSTGNFAVAWIQPKDSVKIKSHCYSYYGYKYCWNEYSGSIAIGVFAQRFNALDVPASKDSANVPKDYKVASDKTLNVAPDISMNDQGSFAIAWESDALKKQKVCYSYYGHKYCYEFSLPVGSAKVARFTADDSKIKNSSKKTLETGHLSKSGDVAFTWNPHAATPSVAIDDLGAFSTQWDSDQIYSSIYNTSDSSTVKAKFYPK